MNNLACTPSCGHYTEIVELHRLRNTVPPPPINLDRIRRAADHSPNPDVAWLQAALTYIDQLLEHINGDTK
jgi:hypothetical protein